MKKIVTVLGARPQFIKASVVSWAIGEKSDISEVLVHTGQHFDANMSDVFFSELAMNKPQYFLDIHGGTHGLMTGRMLEQVERVLLAESPNLVLVYGDTNSTLAGALAAVKLHIPVAHVEAGLRSFNMGMPEEVNRILTDRISRWLFAPTELAVQHLMHEGFSGDHIQCVGDVMFDVALHYGARARSDAGLKVRLALEDGGYVLATIHRAENTGDPHRLATIVEALIATSSDLPVVWPLHPRTRIALQEAGLLDRLSDSVCVINPVGYMEMVQLEKFAALVVTDSGGVQKEAFFYRVPCVTLRDETEWVELIQGGWNRLAPPDDAAAVKKSISSALGSCGADIQPYGSGKASSLIVDRLARDLAS